MQDCIYVERRKVNMDRLCYLFLIFLTGCLVGWIYEEIFYWITEGLLRNRGILYGPWLPIYGIGALSIYAMKPVKKHPVLLFFLCAMVAGIVEYIIGYIGIRFFGMRLWDYRNRGVHHWVHRHPVLWNAALGLPGIALEHRRDHLLSQRGKLRPHGTGIPLLAGTGRVADCPKAAVRHRSNGMPGIAVDFFG